MEILTVPVHEDNYSYVLIDREAKIAGVVDPSEVEPIEMVLEREKLKLDWIFVTHHHQDHIGGLSQLLAAYSPKVCGFYEETKRVSEINYSLKDNQKFQFGNEEVQALHVPGHTSGHMAFWFPDSKALFSGDFLFSLGCGRLFEGSAKEMWESLKRTFDLPEDTNLYCGHEYTESNARFALEVEPQNLELKKRAQKVRELRSKGLATVPVSLKEERQANPFLRVKEATIRDRYGLQTETDEAVFAYLRKMKDSF